jgi:RNA polymerase sigma factor (sigma-70 family)
MAKYEAMREEIKRRLETLTPREREVFYRVIEGLCNKEVADRMGISERTVKAHRAQVMQKLRAISIVDLVKMAVVIDPLIALEIPKLSRI